MEYELRTLYTAVLKSGLSLDAPRSSFDIPSDAAWRMSLPVPRLALSPSPRPRLQKLELETMEDLLRYARKKGLDSLLKIPGFGPLGLDQLKFQLEKHKIMNKAGDSDLYQYIINEPDS